MRKLMLVAGVMAASVSARADLTNTIATVQQTIDETAAGAGGVAMAAASLGLLIWAGFFVYGLAKRGLNKGSGR